MGGNGLSRREHSLEGIERTIIRFNEFFFTKTPKKSLYIQLFILI